MSKQRLSGITKKSGSSLQYRMNVPKEVIKAKNEMWKEMMQRKEEAKQPKSSPMDRWYKDVSYKQAKSITALYLVVSGKKVNLKTIKSNYDLGSITHYRYKHWYENGCVQTYSSPINNLIIQKKDQLIKDMKRSPSPTIAEIKRLYKLALPMYHHISPEKSTNHEDSHVKTDDAEMYDHMLNDEQKVKLMDLANLELSEIKPITKSDVIVGVITGALVGGGLVAYAFLTNGVI